MEVGKPIGGVGVGLGKKPNPGQLAVQGGGGTATVHYDAQYARTLRAAHATIIQSLTVDYPSATPGPLFGGIPGVTRVIFSGVSITRISPPANGIVEVTLHYDSVQRVTPVSTGPNFGYITGLQVVPAGSSPTTTLRGVKQGGVGA